MPPNAIKSYAEKLGISVSKVEQYWEEAKKAIEDEYDKNKESEKFYGTAMKILKNKLKKHEGLTESRFASFLSEDEHVEEVMEEIDFVADFLEAGKAYEAGYHDDSVDEGELDMGIKVEMEHTTNPLIAKRIALDHLTELPDYYTRLEKMEEEGKDELQIDEALRGRAERAVTQTSENALVQIKSIMDDVRKKKMTYDEAGEVLMNVENLVDDALEVLRKYKK
jgi:predicted transcriptional regulator